MNDWMKPLEDALERQTRTVNLFIRDDDAGWADARLYALLDLCQSQCIPVDVAVIPMGLHHGLVDNLLGRLAEPDNLISLHQHGYSHSNHEASGRKYEFGPSRSLAQQQSDIYEGRQLLQHAFDNQLEPFFTPPWNRCTQDTIHALKQNGLSLLSRDVTAMPLDTEGLREIPVTLDWFRKKSGRRLDYPALMQGLIQQFETDNTIGIMLHHEYMDEQDLVAFGRFVDCLKQSGVVNFSRLRGIMHAETTVRPATPSAHASASYSLSPA